MTALSLPKEFQQWQAIRNRQGTVCHECSFSEGCDIFQCCSTLTVQPMLRSLYLGYTFSLMDVHMIYDGNTFTNFIKRFVGYIYEDKNGNIWTSSARANDQWVLSRYDEKSLSIKKATVTEIKSGEGMIFRILEAYDGSIWFDTLSGLYRYDGITFNVFKSSGSEVTY